MKKAVSARVLSWWRSRTHYPYAGKQFRSTGQFDMLRSMRTVYRLMTFCAVVLVVVIVGAVVGLTIPTWFPNLIGVAAVGIMFAATPPARYAAMGLFLTVVRKRWSETWLDADVPLTRLWTMLFSPVSVHEFATYATVLDSDSSARIDGGVDPRVVWALHARAMDVETVRDYMATGARAEDALALHDAGIAASDWLQILQSGVVQSHADERKNSLLLRDGILFVHWARTSRASLHPRDFHTGTARTPRSVSVALEAMEAWVSPHRAPSVHLNLNDRPPCTRAVPDASTRDSQLPCSRCGGTVASGHHKGFFNIPVGPRRGARASVSEWVEAAGVLAPYFIDAGIDLAEARQMVASDECPDIDGLIFLSAWQK